MPDTGERREITRFVNAKEAATVQEAKTFAAKVEQQSRKAVDESRTRKRRNPPPRSPGAPPLRSEEALQDREARDRMADDGSSIPKP